MTVKDPEQSLATLLKLSGKRETPSAERTEQARVAARNSWQRMLTQRAKQQVWSRHWRTISVALAAGLVCVLVIPHLLMHPATIAQITAVDGELPAPAGNSSMSAGAEIVAGTEVVSGDGRLALAMGNSLSLRVDQHTRLRLDDAGHVTLSAGRIYVDSGGLNAHTELCIVTPAGEVRHLGTQFQVYVQDDITRVRVREGRVELSSQHIRDFKQQYVASGEELQVTGAQAVLRHGLPSYGADWEWAAMVAPAFDIENRPLAEVLAWMAREHGWQLRYASESLQQRTHEIRLHGALEQMSAGDAVERLSLITGVPLISQEGVLLVGNKKAGQ